MQGPAREPTRASIFRHAPSVKLSSVRRGCRRAVSASMRSVNSDYRVACCHSSEALPIEQAAPSSRTLEGNVSAGLCSRPRGAVRRSDAGAGRKPEGFVLRPDDGRRTRRSHDARLFWRRVRMPVPTQNPQNRGEFLRRRHTVVGMIAILSALVAAPPWNLEVVALRRRVGRFAAATLSRLRLFRADRLLWVWLYRIWPSTRSAGRGRGA